MRARLAWCMRMAFYAVEAALSLMMLRITVDAWVHGGLLAGAVATLLTATVLGTVWRFLWEIRHEDW